jgi:type I restriction enzyme, S subunit
MRLPAYKSYRPSALEWLREVPAHWEGPKQLGGISSLKGRLGWQGLKAEEYLTEGPYVVSSAHFSDFRIRWDECPRVSQLRYETDSNIQLDEGDVLLMKDGAAMGKLAFVDSLPGPACLNSHLLLFRPITIANISSYVPKFAFYFMQTALFQEHIRINGAGATFLGISQDAISRYKVIWPPSNEQREIVGFLDRETAKIDALIAEQEKLLALLAEKRQATISRAVTRGLNLNVPMKDSGIPWLGEMPAHWEIRPLKSIASEDGCVFIDGDWIESRNISDVGIRYITTGNVGAGFYKEQGAGFITEKTFAELNCTEVLPGDILISRLNMPIGRACVVPDLGCKIVTSVDNVIVRTPADFHRQFVVFRLTASDYLHEASNLASGATMQRISRSELGQIRLTLPPLPEQIEISVFLVGELQRLDSLKSQAEVGIELLKERRGALISAAVTGKIDVRNAVPREAVAA